MSIAKILDNLTTDIFFSYRQNSVSRRYGPCDIFDKSKTLLKSFFVTIIGISGISVPNIAVAGAREIQYSNAAYDSFPEAENANRSFHQAGDHELRSIFSKTVKSSFNLPSAGPAFEEHFDISGYWSFTQPGAALVQQFGQWHILNGQICVTYAGSSRSDKGKCRTLWVDASGSAGLLEGSVNSVGPNRVYRIAIDRNAKQFPNTLILKLKEH